MMNRMFKATGLLWLPGALCLLLTGALPAIAEVVVVNCDQADLEEALREAADDDGQIVFECDGTILITNTMVISTNITLDATDRNVTIASPGGTNGVRLFTLLPGPVEEDDETNLVAVPNTLTLKSLKLVDGSSTNGGGGAIFIHTNAFLEAIDCVFSNNVVIGTNGFAGASGSATASEIRGSTGRDGRSGLSAFGGAIYNLGAASLTECSFLTNGVVGGNGGNGGNGGAGISVGGNGGAGGRGGAAYGGAIYNLGSVAITNSRFNLNAAAGGFGGDGGSGGAGSFGGSSGTGGGAGGASGAALFTGKGASAVIVNSTFALNGATAGDSSDAGNSFGRGKRGGSGGLGSGGGLANYGTNVLLNCTFFANSVAGGNGGNGGGSPSVGGKGGNGGIGWGGNVFSGGKRSYLFATNCTFTDGLATGGTNGLGGGAPVPGGDGSPGRGRGGNLGSSNSVFWLKNSLVAYAGAGTNAHGKFKDGGYNLVSDRSIKFSRKGSSRATNATASANELKIGVLARNGGSVETIALLTNSPAIDMGDTNFVFNMDARGVSRPRDGNGDGDPRGDIGAYEAGLALGPPQIIVSPSNRSVRKDGSVTFTVVAAGDPPLLYQWLVGGEEIDGATSASYTLDGADTSDEGEYSVRVSNNSGSTNSASATLDVLVPPTIEDDPIDTVADLGGTVVLEVVAEGDPTLTYQWFFNDASIPGASLSTYTIFSAQSTNTGFYKVRVCNPHGCIFSGEASVTVSNTPPSIFSVTPTNLTVAAGSPGRFFGEARGARPLTFLWFFNSTLVRSNVVNDSATDVLTIGNATATNEGSYVLVVRNAFSGATGGATSGPVTLTVQTEAPSIDVQPADVDVVAGTNATFGVTAFGSGPLNYRWYFNSNSIPSATNSALVLTSVSSTNDGFYHVVVSNLLGSVTSVVATLTVETLAPAILSQPTSITVAVGKTATATINASGSALRYQWYFNGTTPVPGATTRTLTIANAQPGDAGTYTVVVTNLLGSKVSAPITLNVQTTGASITTQPTSQTVSSGQNATFTVGAGGSTPLSYKWYFNSNAISSATNSTYTVNNAQSGNAGFYHVVVSNLVGAATSAVVTLSVQLSAPVINTQPADTAAFTGNQVTLNVAAVGSLPLTYLWYFNGTNLISALTSSTLIIPSVQLANAGTYHVVITNLVGTATSSNATLTVTDSAPLIQSAPESTNAAVGSSASMTVAAAGSQPLLFQWSFEGTPFSAPTSSNLRFTNSISGSIFQINSGPGGSSLTIAVSAATNRPPTYVPPERGTYAVTVTNALGFVTPDPVTFDVLGL